MKTFDAIIVGAGHNGLVTAAMLAKAGKSVLVLERRNVVGGICVTEELQPGIKVNSLVSGGFLRPDITKNLDLARHGLPNTPEKSGLVSLLPAGGRLRLSNNVRETAEAILPFSKKDADKWPDFVAFMNKAVGFLEMAYHTGMPRLPKFSVAEGIPLAMLGLKLRGMGARDMYTTIRLLPMTAREFLDEWFESDALKAAIASLGIHNANLGVMSAGSAYNLLHQFMLRGGWGQPYALAEIGNISVALEHAARQHGAEIRLQTEVNRILVKDNQAVGVVLVGGEQILANQVVSCLDPKRTFQSLLEPELLDPEFGWNVRNIKMRGVSAKIHLVVDEMELGADTLVLAPSLNYLERAYDAAKYGQISEQPYMEITKSGQVVSIHLQYAPYKLKGAAWDENMRQKIGSLAVDAIEAHFPGIKPKVRFQKVITPLDMDETYFQTEGDINHGQLMLEQFFFMRPIPGWSNHRTPVSGLFLCGSGVHGGGGVSGISGRNAAEQILRG